MALPNRRNNSTSPLRAYTDADRLARLAENCRLLEIGVHNSDDDPELCFMGIGYADAMAIAVTDPIVARVLRRLPEDWKWPRE